MLRNRPINWSIISVISDATSGNSGETLSIYRRIDPIPYGALFVFVFSINRSIVRSNVRSPNRPTTLRRWWFAQSTLDGLDGSLILGDLTVVAGYNSNIYITRISDQFRLWEMFFLASLHSHHNSLSHPGQAAYWPDSIWWPDDLSSSYGCGGCGWGNKREIIIIIIIISAISSHTIPYDDWLSANETATWQFDNPASQQFGKLNSVKVDFNWR